MGKKTAPEDLAKLEFVLSGDVDIMVTVSETGSGDLDMTLSVLDGDEVTAGIDGVSFDLADPDLLDGLFAKGGNIARTNYNEKAVDTPGQGPTFKGGKHDDSDTHDLTVKPAGSGKGKDGDDETSFTLSHSGFDLSLADIENMDFLVTLGGKDGDTATGDTSGSSVEGIAPHASDLDGVQEPPTEETDEPTGDGVQSEVLEEESTEDFGPLEDGLGGAVTGNGDILLLDPLTDEEMAQFDEPEDPFFDAIEAA